MISIPRIWVNLPSQWHWTFASAIQGKTCTGSGWFWLVCWFHDNFQRFIALFPMLLYFEKRSLWSRYAWKFVLGPSQPSVWNGGLAADSSPDATGRIFDIAGSWLLADLVSAGLPGYKVKPAGPVFPVIPDVPVFTSVWWSHSNLRANLSLALTCTIILAPRPLQVQRYSFIILGGAERSQSLSIIIN